MIFNRLAHGVILSFGVAALSRSVSAQAAPGSEIPLDPAIRREVVDTVAAQIARLYVDADTARLIAGRLRDRARSGAYDSATDPRRLADLLTTDLRSVNHDLHLSVVYSPPAAGAGGPRPGGTFGDRSQHYVLGRLDILPGNVGYMEVNGFSGDPGARDAIVAALQYLEPTSAIIFDLRRNRGGSAQLVNFLISHFTGKDTLASVVVRNRGSAGGSTRYTLASVPGPRRPDVPIYVLTSRGTASAGEDFSFVLKNLKRATIVGDRTAGAGHNVTGVRSGYGFQTNISITRVSDPRTGAEWEQVGVQPDVKVDPAAALDVANKLALDKLLATTDETVGATQRRQLELAREMVAARIASIVVPAATLATYTGEYDGGRRVSVVGNTLMYAPTPNALPEAAIPLSDSSFILSSNLARITFEKDQQGQTRIRAALPDGGSTTFARVSPGRQ